MATGRHQSHSKGPDAQKIIIIAAVVVAVVAIMILAAVFIFGGNDEKERPAPPVVIDPNGGEEDPPDEPDPGVTEATRVNVTASDGSAAGELEVEEGESVELTAAVTPATVTEKPVWTSSDEAVARLEDVDGTGLKVRVVAVGAGSATVTVTVDGAKYEFTVTVEEAAPPDDPAPKYTNPLTGLGTEEDLSDYKPYAVMLNNIKKATPQVGLSQADMIFEIPVEGNITRLMGIYQSFKDAEVIGSIRSARPYFIDIARSFDAIYIHAGGSDDAYKSLKSSGLTYIDGVNGTGATFFRDQNRVETMGTEHSLMLDVPTVEPYLTGKQISLRHSEGYTAGFTFAEPENRTGWPATDVEVVFNSSKSTFFEYDSATKQYLVSQYDKPMTDGATDGQLAVRNVIVLKVRISRIPGDSENRLRATLTGSGNGTYMCDGIYQQITWSRASDTAQFVFTDENGEELKLAPGVTYFAIVPSSSGSVQAK